MYHHFPDHLTDSVLSCDDSLPRTTSLGTQANSRSVESPFTGQRESVGEDVRNGQGKPPPPPRLTYIRRIPTDSKKYRNLTPLLKSHATSMQHLLSTLSDDATLRLTLSSFIPLLPYILSFKKLLRELVKSVVGIWSNTTSTEATRISAFLVVRRLAVIGDAGLREMVLRSVYQGLVKGSRNTTVYTLPGVNLMKNSAAELWGLDPSVGYTTGFTFIRQLAIHLRGSINNPSKVNPTVSTHHSVLTHAAGLIPCCL